MMHRKSLKITVRPMGNSLRHKGWRTMHNAKRLHVFITFVMKSKWIRWTYKPSAGLAVSLWEPVLLVDSRMPYGADKKDHRGKRSLHKLLNHLSPVFTLSMSNTGLLSVNLRTYDQWWWRQTERPPSTQAWTHQTPWRLNTCSLFRTAAGWLWYSRQVLATSGFYGLTYLKNRGTLRKVS